MKQAIQWNKVKVYTNDFSDTVAVCCRRKDTVEPWNLRDESQQAGDFCKDRKFLDNWKSFLQSFQEFITVGMLRNKSKRMTKTKSADHVRYQVLNTSADLELHWGIAWVGYSVLFDKHNPFLEALLDTLFKAFYLFTLILQNSVSS